MDQLYHACVPTDSCQQPLVPPPMKNRLGPASAIGIRILNELHIVKTAFESKSNGIINMGNEDFLLVKTRL